MIDNITEALKLIKVISKQFNIVCNDGSKPNRNEEITKMEDSLSKLNTHLISIKTDCIELTKVNTKLEKQLSEYTDWEKKKAHYELYEMARGVFVYRKKTNSQEIEKFIYYCPKCMDKQKESLISKQDPNKFEYKCVNCSWKAKEDPPSPIMLAGPSL
ncbi:hypothetical protein [Akkermansia muciniphila]|uniref:hypothetical protein n=1 Tax=Akkermansia muciniphila TaxID=239935 RepID=UPI0030D1D30F